MDSHHHEQLSRWFFPSLLLHILIIFLFMTLQQERQEKASVVFFDDQEQPVAQPLPALPPQQAQPLQQAPDDNEEVLFNINLAKSSNFGMTSLVSEDTKFAGDPRATEDSLNNQMELEKTVEPEPKQAEQKSETPPAQEQSEALASAQDQLLEPPAASEAVPVVQSKPITPEKKIEQQTPTAPSEKKPERNFWGQAAQSSSPVAKNMTLTKLAEGFLHYAKETSNSSVDINSQDLNLAPTLQRIGWFLQNSFHLHNKPISLDRDVHTSITLHLELDEKGVLLNCYLSPQTNVQALDRNLLRIAQGAAPFPPIPKHVMRNKQTFSVKIPIQIDAKRGTHEYYFIFRG